MDVRKILLTGVLLVASVSFMYGQLAKGKIKFLGNIYSASQITDFNLYWNQVTAENGGKWGSVEGVRDDMKWGDADAANALANANGFLYKHHVLIWGSQQPNWIRSLPKEEQLAEIKQWFAAIKQRYPDLKMIEVVNEPLHAPPSVDADGRGNYIEALGGNGASGWEWVLRSFRMAREYFPNAELLLNDYSIINSEATTRQYVGIVNLLLKEDLIDGIGIQGHAFTVNNMTASQITSNLNILAETGLPIYVTELDIDGVTPGTTTQDDALQKTRYETVFPAFWQHPSIQGITLWGSRPGLWRNNEKAFLFNTNGSKRPAMDWLETYVKNSANVVATSITLTTATGSQLISTKGGTIKVIGSIAPGNATLKVFTWTVSDNTIATVNSAGQVTALKDGKVTITATARDGSGVTATFEVTIVNQGDVVTANEQEQKYVFRAYPNPVVNGKFTIDGTEKIRRVAVLDFNGRNVHDQHVSNLSSIEVNLKESTPGIYAIQLFDGQKYVVKKIMVK